MTEWEWDCRHEYDRDDDYDPTPTLEEIEGWKYAEAVYEAVEYGVTDDALEAELAS